MDFILIVAGFMLLLNSLGVNPAAALAGLGVGGIAVALAAQKTLENVIGGVSLIMDGAVRVGDFFKLGDVLGTIEVIGLRSTRVRTLDRTIVTIPNGQMATMTLENFSVRDQFWLRQLIVVEHRTRSSALGTVLAEVRALLEGDPRILRETSRIRFVRFTESNLELEVVAYVSAVDWNQFLEIQEDLLMRIREVIRSAGVEIGYPARAIYLKNEADAGSAIAGKEALSEMQSLRRP
jgi:MscS family membrane protein